MTLETVLLALNLLLLTALIGGHITAIILITKALTTKEETK